MKRLLILSVLFSNFAFAMEAPPPPSRKRGAEEEYPAAAQKVKREAEQAAIIREPAIQMETQRELSPEVQAAIKHLREIAERGEFPTEIGAQILKNLATVKVRGATEEQKLYNAIANIRSFMDAFPQFYGDVAINGYLIQELAKRYMPDTPLKVAIALATTGAGNWLVNYVGGDAKKRKKVGLLLNEAAMLRELATVRFILDYLPQAINEQALNKSTPLMFAAENGDLPMIQRLLQVPGINVNAQNEWEDTALLFAASNGHAAVVERLLQVPGINVNAQNQKGVTALMRAAGFGHAAVVERLLQAPGINVNAQNQLGVTALISAAGGGHAAVVERLLQAPGINVNAQNQIGVSALMIAASSGHTAVVERLLQAPGINVNAPIAGHGGTALMVAVRNGNSAVVELLLQAPGIEVNARTTQGVTALKFARQSDSPNKDAIIKRLIEFGAIE